MAKGSKGISKKTSKTSSKLLKKTSKSTASKVDKLDKIDISEITMGINTQDSEKKLKQKSLLDHKSLKKDHDKDVEQKESQKKDEGDIMAQLELIGFKA